MFVGFLLFHPETDDIQDIARISVSEGSCVCIRALDRASPVMYVNYRKGRERFHFCGVVNQNVDDFVAQVVEVFGLPVGVNPFRRTRIEHAL